MKYFKKGVIIISLFLLGFNFFCLYHQINYGTLKTYYNSNKSDCEFILPNDLRVVYNSKNRRYAVEITNTWGKQFLWGRLGNWIDNSFAVNTDFKDSCIAKSFAIQYLRERDDYNKRLTGYK